MEIRRSNERGQTKIDWLVSYHTFSFGEYIDLKHRQFSDLRVINDDIVAPSSGFPTHGHRDMEILTYVLRGALEHRDSMGNGSIIHPGDVQIMSAGTGVEHSEFNHSKVDEVHLLQIWIFPSRKGLPPQYQQKSFAPSDRKGKLCPIASSDQRNGSLLINQDCLVYAGSFNDSDRADFSLNAGRCVYIHVAKGNIQINGHQLFAGDGAQITEAKNIKIENGIDSEILLFDLKSKN